MLEVYESAAADDPLVVDLIASVSSYPSIEPRGRPSSRRRASRPVVRHALARRGGLDATE